MLGKIFAPINQATCCGVDQTSVWGCMTASIWARYWPAIILGILAPEDQNELHLPLKLLQGLQVGKKKAHQVLNKQNEGNAEQMSFFLVEFLSTHKFIWVREADIIENFDSDEDINQIIARNDGGKKKKKSARNQTPANSKILQKAIDEGRCALEEFKMLLNHLCGDQLEEYADDEENHSFPVLCKTDDEANKADGGMDDSSYLGDMYTFGSPTGKLTDMEEINELLLSDGIVDYSVAGRKNAKKRAAALKKQ